MQAIVVHNWGGPEVLRFETVPDPTETDDTVVVELTASAVNWHDVLVRRDGRGFPLPRILGLDGAGRRRDTGEEVIILPSLQWGDRSRAPGPGFSLLGDVTQGTYAELIAVPRENLFPKPPSLTWQDAAALPTAGLTAYRALFTRANTSAGETVLVHGAASGVSTFAVMLAAAAGAQVIVTTASEEKITRAEEIGAAGGVLYTHEGWVDEVNELTDGGVDVIIDGVGANLTASLACLKPGGRLALFGATGGRTAEFDVPAVYFGHLSILGTTLGDPADFAGFLNMFARAGLRPVLDSVRPLGDAAAAHTRLEACQHFGKLVLADR